MSDEDKPSPNDALPPGPELDAWVAQEIFGAKLESANWIGITRVLIVYLDGHTEFLGSVFSRKYSTDHNHARKVEDEIDRRGLWKEYIWLLEETVNAHIPDGWERYRWNMVRATPEQRCKAALKVMAKQ